MRYTESQKNASENACSPLEYILPLSDMYFIGFRTMNILHSYIKENITYTPYLYGFV
jgi:hypothetical protein